MLVVILLGFSLTIGLLVALLVRAAVLRWAVCLVNAMMGGREPTDPDYKRVPPGTHPQLRSLVELRIPEPGRGESLAVVAVVDGVNFVLQFLAGLAYHGVYGPFGASTFTRLAALIADPVIGAVTLPIGFGVNVVLLRLMLPATTGRAALVLLAQWVLVGFLILLLVVGAGLLGSLRPR